MYGSKLEIRRFEKTISKYEAQSREKGKIILYGHSLFTRCAPENRWGHPNVEEEVRGKDGSHAILNHGFGTSSADDLLYYYHRMVRVYEPRALVLATGNNDFGMGYEPEEVMDVLARVIQYARADFPEIPIFVFSYTPVLKQKGLVGGNVPRRERFNVILKEYCDAHPDITFVSLADLPLYFEKAEDVGDYDKIFEGVFDTDRTHLNSEGYGKFMDFLRELLNDIL
jgi:lysophospholipase L1-like esterase